MTITTLREGVRAARKDHQCDGCLGTIGKGDRYYSQTNVDGDIYTWRTHQLCWAIIRRYGMDDPDGILFEHTEVRDDLEVIFARLFDSERMELVQAVTASRSLEARLRR